MKILHVIPSLRVGGSERQLMELLARSTADEVHEVAVFDDPGPLAAELVRPVISIGPLGRSVKSLTRLPIAASRLRGSIRRLGIDLVHAHHDIAEVVAAAGTPRSVPFIAERQGVGSNWLRRPALRNVMGLAHRRAAVLLCNSNFVRREALAHDRWPPPTQVVYPGVDRSRFAPLPLPISEAQTITAVANLLPVKRLDRFVRAMGIVRQRMGNVRANIVGGGPEGARLESLSRELGIGDIVHLVGSTDPRQFVREASIVCLTSETESFPNALLESMSMGRPVVAVRVGGIGELVREGADGLLTSEDPEAIAGSLVAYLQDREALERAASSASERADAFPIERMVEGVRATYRQVLEGRVDPQEARDRAPEAR